MLLHSKQFRFISTDVWKTKLKIEEERSDVTWFCFYFFKIIFTLVRGELASLYNNQILSVTPLKKSSLFPFHTDSNAALLIIQSHFTTVITSFKHETAQCISAH